MAIVSLARNAKKAFETVYKLVNAFGEKPITVSMEGKYAQCNFCGTKGIKEIFVSNKDNQIFLPGYPNFSINVAQLAELKKPKVLVDIKSGEDCVIITKLPTEKDPSEKLTIMEHDWKRKEDPFDIVDSLEWIELPLPKKFDVLKYNFDTGNVYLPGAEDTKGAVLYIDSKIVPKETIRGNCYLSIEDYEENFIHPVMYCESDEYKIFIRYMKILK